MVSYGRVIRRSHTFRRTFMAWLAVFALFVQVLAPLSSALAFDAGAGGELQVMCYPAGAIIQDDDPIKPTGAVSCPFCMMHTAPGIFIPEAMTVRTTLTRAKHEFTQPILYVQSSIWRGAPRPSRAPPLSV